MITNDKRRKSNFINGIAPKYFELGFGIGNNCNTWTNKISAREKIVNFSKDMLGIDIGDLGEMNDLYFKKIKSKESDKNDKSRKK